MVLHLLSGVTLVTFRCISITVSNIINCYCHIKLSWERLPFSIIFWKSSYKNLNFGIFSIKTEYDKFRYFANIWNIFYNINIFMENYLWKGKLFIKLNHRKIFHKNIIFYIKRKQINSKICFVLTSTKLKCIAYIQYITIF